MVLFQICVVILYILLVPQYKPKSVFFLKKGISHWKSFNSLFLLILFPLSVALILVMVSCFIVCLVYFGCEAALSLS